MPLTFTDIGDHEFLLTRLPSTPNVDQRSPKRSTSPSGRAELPAGAPDGDPHKQPGSPRGAPTPA